MSNKIKANELADAVTDLLSNYSEAVTEEAKKVVDEIAEQANEVVKNHITWHDKVYSGSFRVKTSFENTRNKRKTWYVESPHYRLTHLLEFGHITRNGGRTRSFPHVKYGDEFVRENFEKRMKEAIEQCRI